MKRTTVRIQDELLNEAKALAARQGRSLNSVMEEALRHLLKMQEEHAERLRVELPVGDGELLPGVDLSPAGIKELLWGDDHDPVLEVLRRDSE